MLTIVCGEDSVASRSYFTKMQSEYSEKGYFTEKIQPNEIEDVAKSGGSAVTLFNEKKIYIVQGLTTYTARKKSKEFENLLKSLIDSKTIEILDWEEKSGREIKLKATAIKEFKPSQTIFQLQESLYPKNLKPFLQQLTVVTLNQEEGFVFTMLSRHTRTLLLTKTNQLPSTVPPWMRTKFQGQAAKWSLDGLIGFYDGLARLDSSIKTSGNIYGIKGSLELLACYFLA